MIKKHFTAGVGRLDAETLNSMVNAAENAAVLPETFQPMGFNGPYLGIIKGNEEIVAERKWKYEIEFIMPAATADDALSKTLADADMLSTCWNFLGLGTDNTKDSLNISELNNSDTEIMGVQVSNLPAGFTLQPVPTNTFVWCWTAQTPVVTDGTNVGEQGYLILFEYTNQFDGSC